MCIPLNKVIISIGYNGKEAQQHKYVIEKVIQYKSYVKEKIFILFPMTYGYNQEYTKIITSMLDEDGTIGYKVFNEYLNDKEVAKLRKATDIFVHAQTTDAFSSSIREYLYLNKICYNPSWIQYSELKDKDVFYYEYNSFEELAEMLETCISEENINNIKINNSNVLFDNYSWQAVTYKWRIIYV